jgi:hypothetical protein
MKKQIRFWAGILAAALIISTLVLTGCSSASSPAAAPPVTSSVMAAAVTSDKGPGQEGITVHGHWTIEVRNPDGSLAERREFENALNGDNILTALLSRNNSMGPWAITLRATSTDQNAFLTEGGTPTYGYIVENTPAETVPQMFKTLTVSQTSSPNTVVLSGTATAQRNGNIKEVGTEVWLLDKSLPPSNDYNAIGPGNSPFTATTLADAVNLTAGQQVAVTVVISFS